ncbi:hypothetical protein CVT25_004354 [Psilocybe cyanescens]|uniref:Uncharacterized protein n=1 Tax=Psilocybe cyanescens TaxID=93625 RepID=A0A409XQ74_PSICY|nr:hypothetical protein CVT25_004354 [Psilocybe cyanescens]
MHQDLMIRLPESGSESLDEGRDVIGKEKLLLLVKGRAFQLHLETIQDQLKEAESVEQNSSNTPAPDVEQLVGDDDDLFAIDAPRSRPNHPGESTPKPSTKSSETGCS